MTTTELVTAITDYVNSYSVKSEEFVSAMNKEHRTLQQSFTRLCLKWLENCASDDYRHDGRNEDSHTISKTMLEAFKKTMCDNLRYERMDYNPSNYLPMV